MNSLELFVVCLQVSRPRRWAPLCLEGWATATGTRSTSTTTTRWASISIGPLFAFLHLHSTFCLSATAFDTIIQLIHIFRSYMLFSHGGILNQATVLCVWSNGANGRLPSFDYSLHILTLPHLLSFRSANNTLCEYKCVSESTCTPRISFPFICSCCLSVSMTHQAVNKRNCVLYPLLFPPPIPLETRTLLFPLWRWFRWNM